jgi:two-component system cell cycle response regulator CpdR
MIRHDQHVACSGWERPVARILIAEDDLAVRQFVVRALELRGHQVTSTEDGLAALERLNAESYDLLVSDIVMPGMDGIELALKAGRDWPRMAILLMTGYAHERQRAHNLDALGQTVLSKPFTLQQICDAVEDTLKRARE